MYPATLWFHGMGCDTQMFGARWTLGRGVRRPRGASVSRGRAAASLGGLVLRRGRGRPAGLRGRSDSDAFTVYLHLKTRQCTCHETSILLKRFLNFNLNKVILTFSSLFVDWDESVPLLVLSPVSADSVLVVPAIYLTFVMTLSRRSRCYCSLFVLKLLVHKKWTLKRTNRLVYDERYHVLLHVRAP